MRTALVTGGAKGIGRGIALALAHAGWSVGICYRTSGDAADATVRELEAAGARAVAVQADVADATQAEALVSRVTEALGPIDALVHAAGPYRRAHVLDETPAGWRDMLAGNLDSFFYCARLVAPGMIARKRGRILAFGMANADRAAAVPGVAAHYVAKVGVLVMVRTFARALAAHGITVNAISPGYIDSGSSPAAEMEAALKTIPAGRFGEIDDVVGAAAYLLSDAAQYVTGANLILSGGWGI